METQCTPCGKVLSSPTAAAKHVLEHEPVKRAALKGQPLFRVRWARNGLIEQVLS